MNTGDWSAGGPGGSSQHPEVRGVCACWWWQWGAFGRWGCASSTLLILRPVAERRIRGSRDRGVSACLWWSSRARNCCRARTRGASVGFRACHPRSFLSSVVAIEPKASAARVAWPSTDARHPVRARWTQSDPKGGCLQSIAVRWLASALALRAGVDLGVPVWRRTGTLARCRRPRFCAIRDQSERRGDCRSANAGPARPVQL
jgi:hypothetical protein